MDWLKDLIGIAANSDNDAIVLAVVIILGIVVIAVALTPLYKLVTKAAKEKRQQYMEREQILVNTLKDNTEVLSGIQKLLESTNSNCASCKDAAVGLYKQIRDKQEANTEMLTEIRTVIIERLPRKDEV